LDEVQFEWRNLGIPVPQFGPSFDVAHPKHRLRKTGDMIRIPMNKPVT